ncbi:hypothetical protein DL98DRAFT_189900 [Cadophora sp. DSE1049]|nr:hypothetical protein DL98DRAFT_189900 [Cadophora sp. DSE1049]
MTHSFDDVVAGKRQGFSGLLHGPPGVGKTLMIAEHLRSHSCRSPLVSSVQRMSTPPQTTSDLYNRHFNSIQKRRPTSPQTISNLYNRQFIPVHKQHSLIQKRRPTSYRRLLFLYKLHLSANGLSVLLA